MSNLTRRELVVRISNETGMVQQTVGDVIKKMFDHLVESLSQGQTVELRNFGVFEVVTRKARVGRNPKRPERDVPIPAHPVVKFKTGKELKAKVLKLGPLLGGNASLESPRSGL